MNIRIIADTSCYMTPALANVLRVQLVSFQLNIGDTVFIDSATGTVSVNGQSLNETYLDDGTVTTPDDVLLPLTVPEGKLFVMGDNRQGSLDSRASEVGLIDERDILGKVLLRIAPFSSAGRIE